jgi:glycosyltransferase involved in cell wall biosynthesis
MPASFDRPAIRTERDLRHDHVLPSPTRCTRGVSVIIPVYNEELGIVSTIRSLQQTLLASRHEFEIIVVNDGSTDRTPGMLERLTGVRLIHHRTNRGYGASLKTGIQRAQFPLIAILDADGTYPVDQLLPMLEQLDEQCDMVVGARLGKHVHQSWQRAVIKQVLRRYAEWLTNHPIPDLNSGMRIFRKQQAERFSHLLPNGFSFTSTITMAMLRHHCHVEFIAIDYYPRIGKSKIRPVRETLNFLQLIVRTAFYLAPLRVLLPIASLLFAMFGAMLAWDLFFLHDVTGRTQLLMTAALQISMFALLADLIHKRSLSP